MKILRKIVDSNKGIFTFWLIMVFLTAGFIKNSAGSSCTKSPKSYSTYQSSDKVYDLLSAKGNDHKTPGFFDRLEKDFDTDDTGFLFQDNNSSKLIFNLQSEQQFLKIGLPTEIYRLALYDLYCNWKLHLS